MKLIYINEEHAIQVHQKILHLSGGGIGYKDLNNLRSPLHHIQNDDYYPSFEEKLTHLIFCINKFHAFSDGNKRTSIALGTFFLLLNGLDVFADKFVIEMENIAVAVADNLIDKSMLHEIVYSVINEEDYSEELKMKIIEALTKVIPNPDYDEINHGLEFYIEINKII